MLKIIQVLVFLVVSLFPHHAISATEQKLPVVQEERALALFAQLRCVVCQNQSINDSDADVAKDLRIIVRELIASGRTDTEIKSFLVARYGEFILLKPVFAIHTIILWVMPVLLLAAAGFGLMRWGRRRSQTVSKALSEEEEAELAEVLDSTRF